MARRHYSSNARETSLTSGVNASATSIAVDSPVGYPVDVPFVVHCELGTSSEEIMLVTAVVGDQWTVERGYDSSTAVAHDVGAKIVHGVAAIDMDEANEHVNASADVHGLSGGAVVVGTTSSQTLTNKTLTSPTINGGTWTSPSLGSGTELDSPVLLTPTIADFTNATHTHADAANGGTLPDSGGDTWYRFPAAVSETGLWSPGVGEKDVNGMSITYTAPAAWPEDANNIIYNFTFYITSVSATFNILFVSDSTTLVTMTCRPDDVSGVNTFTLSWPGALTTANTSHTAKMRIDATSGTLFERAFWMTLN